MNDYWYIISAKHQDKVRNLAKTYGVSIERAFRNIVRHLEWEMSQMAEVNGFERFLTAHHIEGRIDLIIL